LGAQQLLLDAPMGSTRPLTSVMPTSERTWRPVAIDTSAVIIS
jgi:hypothetical protein